MSAELPIPTALIADELFPFARRYVDRGGGIRMHYVDEGAGPPVLMVHGNPTWSFYYRNLIMALRATHRCLAPDHVGMGLSDKPADSAYAYTLAQRVADLSLFINFTNIKQSLTLVVHDWGGMIGMAWAAQHPDRVAKLVVLNTGAFPLPPSKPFPWQLRLTRTPLGTLLVRGFNLFAWTATFAAMTRHAMPEAVRDAYVAPYADWHTRIATLRFVQDIPLRAGDPGFDIVAATAEKLPALADKPLLIAWGGKDFVFDDHFLAEWRRRMPHAQVHYFADAGHYVLEDAADEVVPLIAGFLSDG